jgi:hypothetical protein
MQAAAGARRQEGAYAGFLEAAVGLADASTALRPLLSRRARIELGSAILRVGEADRAVGCALASHEPGRLATAAGLVERARAALVAAQRSAAVDAARRRTLRPV